MHGKFGLLSAGKASSHRTTLPSFLFFACVQCFRVSVIHRALTWTTGSLTCARSYACVYARGWGTPTSSQHNILTRKLTNLSCIPDGIRTSGNGIHWISRPTLYQFSHHVPTTRMLFFLSWNQYNQYQM